MRRNNTTRSESKEDPPLLLAGKRREKPVESEEEKPNKCVDNLCELLGTLFVIAILFVGLVLVAEPKKMEPAGGQTQPVAYPPVVYGVVGEPANPISGIFSDFRNVQLRFAFIENLANVDQETLAHFKAEMDRLGNFLAKTQPGDRLPDQHRVLLAERFSKIKEQLETIEKNSLGVSV